MRSLSTAELLHVWETHLDAAPVNRSLALLNAAAATEEPDLDALTIGQRDARLLQLRESLFGSKLSNTANCPSCQEKVEWESDINDFKQQPQSNLDDTPLFQVLVDGFEVVFRLLVIADFFQLQAGWPIEENEKLLLQQCMVVIKKNGEPCQFEDLPAHIHEAVEERLANEDPQADIRISLACPVCLHEWQAPFSIERFLWSEIHEWIKDLLQEVYILAKHFGWSEREILSMSPQRRRLYLQMIFA